MAHPTKAAIDLFQLTISRANDSKIRDQQLLAATLREFQNDKRIKSMLLSDEEFQRGNACSSLIWIYYSISVVSAVRDTGVKYMG